MFGIGDFVRICAGLGGFGEGRLLVGPGIFMSVCGRRDERFARAAHLATGSYETARTVGFIYPIAEVCFLLPDVRGKVSMARTGLRFLEDPSVGSQNVFSRNSQIEFTWRQRGQVTFQVLPHLTPRFSQNRRRYKCDSGHQRLPGCACSSRRQRDSNL